jgi:hypothetical protein
VAQLGKSMKEIRVQYRIKIEGENSTSYLYVKSMPELLVKIKGLIDHHITLTIDLVYYNESNN